MTFHECLLPKVLFGSPFLMSVGMKALLRNKEYSVPYPCNLDHKKIYIPENILPPHFLLLFGKVTL